MSTLMTESLTRGFEEPKAINGPSTYVGHMLCKERKLILEIIKSSKILGRVTTVDSISFEVFEGEIFELISLNGAGKATTIIMLPSLINPDSGNATVRSCGILKEKDGVRSSIGLVLEEEAVDIYLTGKNHPKSRLIFLNCFVVRLRSLLKHGDCC